jgi:hypothetical protein
MLYSLAFIAVLWVFWEIWWTVLEVKCVRIRCGLPRARPVPEPLLCLALRSPKTTDLVWGQVTSDTILVSGPSAFYKQERQSRRQKHVSVFFFFFFFYVRIILKMDLARRSRVSWYGACGPSCGNGPIPLLRVPADHFTRYVARDRRQIALLFFAFC